MKERPTGQQILQVLADELPYLRQRFGVKRIALYGSYARGTASPRSDVDVLVELERPLGLQFVALAQYLEDRLGLRVDLLMASDLRRNRTAPRYRHIAADIERNLIYVQPSS